MPEPCYLTRRTLLQTLAAGSALGLLSGCRSPVKPIPLSAPAPTRAPTPVPPGPVTLRLVAPSGLMPSAERAARGVERLRQTGYSLSNTGCLARRDQRFAGNDAARADDFNALLHQTPPQLIVAARGGYGAMRLLPLIDWARLCPRLQEARTLVMGYSDFTAIQCALLSQGGVTSFAGPMLYSDFGAEVPSIDTMNGFVGATTQSTLTVRGTGLPRTALHTEGLFWGGNLSVIAHLVGTPYFPQVNGGLLFLEDVGEQPYRIERMLQQLNLAGVLQRQQAIVLGDFSLDNVRDHYDPTYTIETVAEHVRRVTGVPVFTGFPFGHIRNKATFPLGSMASLRTDATGYSVHFADYPHYRGSGLDFAALTAVL